MPTELDCAHGKNSDRSSKLTDLQRIASMAGRHRMPRHSDGFRGYRDGPRPIMNRGPGLLPPHPAALEEELELQRRDIQNILAENRVVVDDNTILQRQLTAAKEDTYRLGQIMQKVQADKEAHTRELIERGRKLEADLRASEPLKAEVMQLRAEVQKLNSLRQDLLAKVQGLTQDINRLKTENQQIVAMRADIDRMRKELIEARRAYEYEKKANEEQVEQKQAMEKSLISMAREIEKLRAEQLSTDWTARGLGRGGYGMLNGSPEMRYSGPAFNDGYSSARSAHNRRVPPRRAVVVSKCALVLCEDGVMESIIR
ncbi:hypothetical protein L6164_026872 [Bauhinia variegata]|uniref:Uncharacterized protein n=1 Tax=Bauhinia variegata TaxID=167791 RepID=A0ACB9LR91_BAUVA|nr:hypothetical protein L6164_026872 [Bauhinia variegata]